MSYFQLVLRAVKPELNINRSYTIYLNKGLFESWVVMIAYGRYNVRGQQKNYPFFSIEDAKSFIKKTIHKRLRSEKRIGCNYTIVCQKASDDFYNLIGI
jgi:hypothetical protein